MSNKLVIWNNGQAACWSVSCVADPLFNPWHIFCTVSTPVRDWWGVSSSFMCLALSRYKTEHLCFLIPGYLTGIIFSLKRLFFVCSDEDTGRVGSKMQTTRRHWRLVSAIMVHMVDRSERKWQKQDDKEKNKQTYNWAFFKKNKNKKRNEKKGKVRVYKRGGGRKGERQRLLQLVQSAGSR